jgi:hypothetical protein
MSYPGRPLSIFARTAHAFAAACLLVAAFLFAASGRMGLALFDLTLAVVNAGCFLFHTRRAARQKIANRPRPDYALIAEMEREIYGETFTHDGAPRASGASGVVKAHCPAGHPYAITVCHCSECDKAARRERDVVFLAMMAGAKFGPGKTVVMPSGRRVTGTGRSLPAEENEQ